MYDSVYISIAIMQECAKILYAWLLSVPEPKPAPAWIAFSIADVPVCYTRSDIHPG